MSRQMKLSNIDNWSNGELSKIRKSDLKIEVIKMVNNKKCKEYTYSKNVYISNLFNSDS
jgi:hypothetical protein